MSDVILPNPQNEAQQLMTKLGIGSGANWDELVNGQEVVIAQTLKGSVTLLKEATTQVLAAGVADQEFHDCARGTAEDLTELGSRFRILHERRRGRTGPTVDNRDYTDYMTLGLEYTALNQLMAATIPLGLINLAEYQARAERVMNARDASVVTDVESREPAAPVAEQPTAE